MRFLIADDHPLYLGAIQALLERLHPEVAIETAGCLSEVLDRVTGGGRFDLLLLDFSMPGMDGARGVGETVRAAAGAPVVVMSGVALPDDVGACVAAGAKGFLPKTLEPKVFSSALNVILTGGTYLPIEMAMAGHAPPPPEESSAEPHGLTERERTILAMLVSGKSNKEIARLLELREVTIKVQLTRIYKKLGAKNRAQAAMLVAQNSLLG